MSNNESVMKTHDESSSYEERLQKEYETAVAEGFNGTKEEYLTLRGYV